MTEEIEVKEKATIYPELTEDGEKEAQFLLEGFKKAMIKACEETLSKVYTDIIPNIESDSWYNYRNQMIDGFKDYSNREHAEYDFKEIRKQIFKDFREDIIKDLNQDLLKENEELKKEIEWLRDLRINH